MSGMKLNSLTFRKLSCCDETASTCVGDSKCIAELADDDDEASLLSSSSLFLPLSLTFLPIKSDAQGWEK